MKQSEQLERRKDDMPEQHAIGEKRFIKPRLETTWRMFASDINYRVNWKFSDPIPRAVSQPGDYPGLTPEKWVEWFVSMKIDFFWSWIKKYSGHAMYQSKILPPMPRIIPDFYQCCCHLSKKHGLLTVAYTCGGYDLFAGKQHPEWFGEPSRHGHWACLNAVPFWEREFAAIREALSLAPADALFYDMIGFDGSCRCRFCKEQYREFYDEEMPDETHVDKARFRMDTSRKWAQEAVASAKSILPEIQVAVNNVWMPGWGLPYEVLPLFQWQYCEHGHAEWMGEIMRGYHNCPLVIGNSVKPRDIAHLTARRIHPIQYSYVIDYRTGSLPDITDWRVAPIRRTFQEMEKKQAFLNGSSPIPYASVMVSERDLAGIQTKLFSNYTGYQMEMLTRAGITNIDVTRIESVLEEALRAIEFLAIHGIAETDLESCPRVASWHPPETVARIKAWVEGGGVALISGGFAVGNKNNNLLNDFVDQGLLGVKRIDGPIPVDSYLTVLSRDKMPPHCSPIHMAYAFRCETRGAVPLATGIIGNEPWTLVWLNKVGDGKVIYIAGDIWNYHGSKGLAEGADSITHWLSALVQPQLRRMPLMTSMRYPAEAWLNVQPAEKRLVLHLISYEAEMKNVRVDVRADLVRATARIVYPATSTCEINGRKSSGYVRFVIPSVSEHIIVTIPQNVWLTKTG